MYNYIIDIYLRRDKACVIFFKLFIKIDETCFFFKLLLILPIRQLAIKRGTLFISNMGYKIRKFLFVHHKSISSFVHLTSIMLGIKEVKCSTKTVSSDSKSEDLHDDPRWYIVRTTNKIYDSFKERIEILTLNEAIWII